MAFQYYLLHILSAFSVICFFSWLFILTLVFSLEAYSRNLPSSFSSHQTIVVFGALVFPDAPCTELAARLDHAIMLHAQNGSPVAVSGGFSGSISETEVMYNYLVNNGVNDSKVFCLLPGYNSLATMKSIAHHGFNKQWVAVSSPYHSARLLYLKSRFQLNLSLSCPAMSRLSFLYLFSQRLRESLAISYLVVGDLVSALSSEILPTR